MNLPVVALGTVACPELCGGVGAGAGALGMCLVDTLPLNGMDGAIGCWSEWPSLWSDPAELFGCPSKGPSRIACQAALLVGSCKVAPWSVPSAME